MDIILFILILSGLVIIHELGHFWVARKYKVKVEEFGVGYPPKAKLLKVDKLGTQYTLNWLPIGGFVRLYGEEGLEEGQGNYKPEQAFCNKSVRQRLAIIAAGVVMNFVFGAVIFAGIYTYLGIKEGLPQDLGYVMIKEVAPGSPSDLAGFEPGDKVIAVVNSQGEKAITNTETFIKLIGASAGETVAVKLTQPEAVKSVYVRNKEEIPAGQGSIGVVITDYDMVHYPLWQMPFRGIVVGVQSALDLGLLIFKSLGMMVNNIFTRGEVPKDVAGPVGIAYMATKEKLLSQGLIAFLNFAAMLSINLAIINILPIPPLDGGRAMLLTFEGITGKRLNQEIERRMLAAGMLFFLGLILLISIKDVWQVIGDSAVREWFRGLVQ